MNSNGMWEISDDFKLFKQIALATSTTAVVDVESWPVARQISNSDYGFSRSFAFAIISETQRRRNYWKARGVKYFLDNVKNNLW